MQKSYKSNISNARWYVYDILGNLGWISYIVCIVLSFVKLSDDTLYNVLMFIPSIMMLIGIVELINERINKLDRVLPLYRLFLGFGSLTIGGLLGFIIGLVLAIIQYNVIYLIALIGGFLCFVFAGLLFNKYQRQYEEIHDEVTSLHGAYYPTKNSESAIILMLGDSYKDRMAKSGAKYLNNLGVNVLAVGTHEGSDYSHVEVPVERFKTAIEFLRNKGNKKFGIAGASTTGMDSLIAASYYSELTLTIAISPSDFIMEGFIRDGLDGARERPSESSSTSYKGKPLPYLPYAYRHPNYWQMIKKEAKEGGDFVASRKMFDESEKLHQLGEEELIKVENIKGHIVFIGAEDDVLWDTVKYINRMNRRLKEKKASTEISNLIYKYGTHFAFPQKMLNIMLPVFGNALIKLFKSGRKHSKQCKKTRVDIDNKLKVIIQNWINE